MAWQLVLVDGGQPDETTDFPIYLSDQTKKGNPRRVNIAPGIRDRRILDALVDVQPFTEAKYGHDPAADHLWILNRLDNIDKHRLLLAVVHRLDYRGVWWGSDEGDREPRRGRADEALRRELLHVDVRYTDLFGEQPAWSRYSIRELMDSYTVTDVGNM